MKKVVGYISTNGVFYKSVEELLLNEDQMIAEDVSKYLSTKYELDFVNVYDHIQHNHYFLRGINKLRLQKGVEDV